MESFQFDEEPPVYGHDQPHLQDGVFGDQDEDSYAPPAQTNGFLHEEVEPEPALPPLHEMQSEESWILREWKRKRAIELEEKSRISAEKHEAVLEEAKREQEAIYSRRQLTVVQSKATNREKEKLFVSNLENLNAKPGANYWEAVTAHINFDIPTGKKKAAEAKKNEPARVSTQLADQKPGKHTDLARMRQILLKLKHNPLPAHTVPLPEPETKEEGGESGAKKAEAEKTKIPKQPVHGVKPASR